MNTKQFDLRVNKAMNEYKANLKKALARAKRSLKKEPNESWIQNEILRLERNLKNGSPFRLALQKRLRVFRNCSNKCEIDLINESGHSYHWWAMLKRINGHLCLNTYRYSNQTANHIIGASQVLEKLGVKYTCIDAPQGLQNLESAANYAANEIGEAIVAYKYSRNKSKFSLEICRKRIKNLAKIGVEVTQEMIDVATVDAEASRRRSLERQKARRNSP